MCLRHYLTLAHSREYLLCYLKLLLHTQFHAFKPHLSLVFSHMEELWVIYSSGGFNVYKSLALISQNCFAPISRSREVPTSSCVCYVLLSWLQLLETLWMSDVHDVLSSTVLLSSWRLMPMAPFMESLYLIFGFCLFLLPSIFPSSYCLFQGTLVMMCLK